MAKCFMSGKELPELNVHFKGMECREKDRIYCPHFSHNFVNGTNCRLCRKPIDVRTILGIKAEVKNVQV